MTRKSMVHIVEDEADMREALALLLQTAGHVARAYPSAEALLADVSFDQPMCLLLDVRLPGMSGLELIRHLQNETVRPVVVMITGHGDVAMAVEAMRAGALHFLEKPFEPSELLEVVDEALMLVGKMADEDAAVADIEDHYRTLTPREQQVMALLAEGLPTKSIATRLGISARTAEHHRAAVMKKMDARSIPHLVRMSLTLQKRARSAQGPASGY